MINYSDICNKPSLFRRYIFLDLTLGSYMFCNNDQHIFGSSTSKMYGITLSFIDMMSMVSALLFFCWDSRTLMLDILVIIAGGPLCVATSGTPPPLAKACAPNNALVGATTGIVPPIWIGCPLTMVSIIGTSPPLYVDVIIKLPMLELLALVLSSPSANMSQSPLVFRTWLMWNLHRT